MAELKLYPEEAQIFVDESGIDSFFLRLHGWAKRGTQVFGEVCGKRSARESFIAAKTSSKVFAPLAFKVLATPNFLTNG